MVTLIDLASCIFSRINWANNELKVERDNMTAKNLLEIADALGVDPHDLLDG